MDKNSENLLQGFPEVVESFTVYGGFDKDRKPEIIEVTLHKGDCACVCGKTGSGKTRLLEDIEYLASGDSPSGRKMRINGLELTEELRLELENRFCACLSQSMNFVMELSCRDFIFQHAGSRGIPCTEELMEKILACANSLAGEPLHPEDMITALSGGQSRALMIADIAFLSSTSRKMPVSTRTPSSGSWRRKGRSFSFPPMIRSWPCPVKNGSSLKTAESGELSPAQRRKRSF